MINDNLPKSAGVYIIKNAETGSVYIGKTVNLARRFSDHLAQLRRGRHHNTRLQAAWHASGEAQFTFCVHVLAPEDEIDAIERDLIQINMGDSCYNWSPFGGARRPRWAEETITVSLRITTAMREELKRLGGAKWIRNEIMMAQEPGC